MKKPGTGQEDKGYVPSVGGTVSTSKNSGRTHAGSVSSSGPGRTSSKDGRGATSNFPSKPVSNTSGGYVPPMGKK
jgi:hypothetical protein